MICLIFIITNFYQCLITSNVLFDEADSGLEQEKKNILLDTVYIVFFFQ